MYLNIGHLLSKQWGVLHTSARAKSPQGRLPGRQLEAALYACVVLQRGQNTDSIPRLSDGVHSWRNRIRKVCLRYEKLHWSYKGLLHLACTLMCWRQTIVIYG
jgi:hypothetical protein